MTWGRDPWGSFPWGTTDWALRVLWDELPDEKKKEDLDAGGWYRKFVECMVPSFNELLTLVQKKYELTLNPRTARKDLLRYIAGCFGIVPDLDEPEEYQRMKIEIAARWRLIKGQERAYEVLCAIHGFDVMVRELFWDGTRFVRAIPFVYNEAIGAIP